MIAALPALPVPSITMLGRLWNKAHKTSLFDNTIPSAAASPATTLKDPPRHSVSHLWSGQSRQARQESPENREEQAWGEPMSTAASSHKRNQASCNEDDVAAKDDILQHNEYQHEVILKLSYL